MAEFRNFGRALIAGSLLLGLTAAGQVDANGSNRPDLGTLDTTFNPDARLTPPGTLVQEVPFEQGSAVIEQHGGRLVAVGTAGIDSIALARYSKTGEIDRSFGDDGFVLEDGLDSPQVGGIHLQGTGQKADLVTVGGNFDGFLALRHTADGELDPNFGDGGIATLPIDQFDEANGSAIQRDGKLLAVGLAGNPFAGTEALALGRFTADGETDTSFGGGDGYVTLQVMEGTIGFGVAQQRDGRILVTGLAQQPVEEGGQVMVVARFLEDGTLDTSFGSGDGYVTLEIGFQTGGYSIQQVKRQILVSGTGNADDKQAWLLARFNSDGSLDTSFGSGDGYVTAAPSSPDLADGIAFDAVVKGNGSIVATGSFGPSPAVSTFFIAGFTRDGVLNERFGDGGFTQTIIGSFSEPTSATLQRNGRVVVIGEANLGGAFGLAMARYIT